MDELKAHAMKIKQEVKIGLAKRGWKQKDLIQYMPVAKIGGTVSKTELSRAISESVNPKDTRIREAVLDILNIK